MDDFAEDVGQDNFILLDRNGKL